MNGPCVAFDGETVTIHLHGVPAAPSDAETVKETKKEAPDGGSRAWFCIFACMLLIALTSGLGKSFGGVKAAYVKDLRFKNEIADLFMPGMFSVMTLLWAPVASALIRNLGARTMLSIGCGLCAVGFLVSMAVYSADLMVLSLGLCVGTGFSIIANYTVFVIGKLFKNAKPLALGLTLSGGCVGHEFMPNILEYLLLRLGVRGTFGVMGAAYIAVCIFCLFAIGDPDCRLVTVTTEVPVAPAEPTPAVPVETAPLPGCSTAATSLPGCSFWETPEASSCWEEVPVGSSFWEGVSLHSQLSQASEETSFEGCSEIPAPSEITVTVPEVKKKSAFVALFVKVSEELGFSVMRDWTFWLITLSSVLFGLGNSTMIAALKFFSGGVSVFNFGEFYCVLSIVVVRLTYGLLVPKSTFPRTLEFAVSMVGAAVAFMCLSITSTSMLITSLAVGGLFSGAWGALIPPVLGDCLGVSNIGKSFALLKFFRGAVTLCWIYPKSKLRGIFGATAMLWVDFGFVVTAAVIAALLCILIQVFKVRH